jgi:uncharacterized protein DUF6335
MDKNDKLIDWKETDEIDRNRDGIPDDIEPDIPDVSASSAKLAKRLREDPLADPTITAGDLDATWENAQFSGDETPLGETPTPDQAVADEVGRAIGIEYADDETLKVGEKEKARDERRWELDPASSEDYLDRIKEERER